VWTVAVVGVVVAGLLAWRLWPAAGPGPRARQYLASTACLLTDGQGVAGAQAARVWAAMQDVSAATRVKVQYLAAIGATTAADAAPYVASLAQRHCAVVVAVGGPQVGAVALVAAKYPDTRFVTVGGTTPARNVQVVAPEPAARVGDRVGALVRAGVKR
jgi:basic membrane lipoprotein Med (substrate-binding protein (PBP1-ABC) superfamily)